MAEPGDDPAARRIALLLASEHELAAHNAELRCALKEALANLRAERAWRRALQAEAATCRQMQGIIDPAELLDSLLALSQHEPRVVD